MPLTHTSSVAHINKRIRDAGIEHIVLQGGRGYQYFVYDDAGRYETCSEYVCYVRDLPVQEWVERARQFSAAMGA